MVIAGQHFIAHRAYISSLFKAITNEQSIDNLEQAISDCLSKEIPAIMQSIVIHDAAAKSFKNILRDMLENGLPPNDMRRDIVQALLSRPLGDMTMPERSQQSKLVNLLEEMENEDYLSHPKVLFGSTRSFVTAVLDAHSTLGPTGRKIHAVANNFASTNKCECFLTFGAEGCDAWTSFGAPALGYQVSHAVEVSFLPGQMKDDDDNSVAFDLATLDITSAGKSLGDIAESLSNRRDLIRVTVYSSVTEGTAGIPFDSRLSLLLRNDQLTFVVFRALVSTEQEEFFALSSSSLVFEKCEFMSKGDALFGNTIDPKNVTHTGKMRVRFNDCKPSLEFLSEACMNGWIESLGLETLTFGTSDVAFFQKLFQAECKKDSNFHLEAMGDDIMLTLGSKKLRGEKIRQELMIGKEPVSALFPLTTCINTLFQHLNLFLIHFLSDSSPNH